MAKFKNKQGGVCEVFTQRNIERLRKNPEYTEITEKPIEEKKPLKKDKTKKIEEVAEVEPLQ